MPLECLKGTRIGTRLSQKGETMHLGIKLLLLAALLLQLSGCMQEASSTRGNSKSNSNASGGGSNGGSTGPSINSLNCAASEAGEGVVCGQLVAADGRTPIVGATIYQKSAKNGKVNLKDNGPSGAVGKPWDQENDCKTDLKGRFACAGVEEDVSPTTKIVFERKGYIEKELDVKVEPGRTKEIPVEQTRVKPRSGNWLVVPGEFDGVQLLLSQLKGCKLTGNPSIPHSMRASAECSSLGLDVLNDSNVPGTFSKLDNLLHYDFIFINCPHDMSAYDKVIQDFVAQGGNIYYSDWAASGLDSSFPDHVHFGEKETLPGKVLADVKHQGLSQFLTNVSFMIFFDLSTWVPITKIVDPSVQTFVTADTTKLGGHNSAPITVGWRQDKGGCVFFTSYHIEAALSGADQEQVLKYLLMNLDCVCSKV
jgi:hypothetical protein